MTPTTPANASLLDLLRQQDPTSAGCRIAVASERGSGVLFLHHGQVIWAASGDVRGLEAVDAILRLEPAECRRTRDAIMPSPNMQLGVGELIARAARAAGVFIDDEPSCDAA